MMKNNNIFKYGNSTFLNRSFNLGKRHFSIFNLKATKYITSQKRFNNFKKFTHFLCSILILLFVLFLLIIITIFTEDEELSIPLMRTVITEIVIDILYSKEGARVPFDLPLRPAPIREEETRDPFDLPFHPAPIPATIRPSDDDSSIDLDSDSDQKADICPCCEIAYNQGENGCKCFRETHQLDPPVEGMGVNVSEDTNRVCCICLEDSPSIGCYACECTFCDNCISSHSHPDSEDDQPESSSKGKEKDDQAYEKMKLSHILGEVSTKGKEKDDQLESSSKGKEKDDQLEYSSKGKKPETKT